MERGGTVREVGVAFVVAVTLRAPVRCSLCWCEDFRCRANGMCPA